VDGDALPGLGRGGRGEQLGQVVALLFDRGDQHG
jgi:hypothetical protein